MNMYNSKTCVVKYPRTMRSTRRLHWSTYHLIINIFSVMQRYKKVNFRLFNSKVGRKLHTEFFISSYLCQIELLEHPTPKGGGPKSHKSSDIQFDLDPGSDPEQSSTGTRKFSIKSALIHPAKNCFFVVPLRSQMWRPPTEISFVGGYSYDVSSKLIRII